MVEKIELFFSTLFYYSFQGVMKLSQNDVVCIRGKILCRNHYYEKNIEIVLFVLFFLLFLHRQTSEALMGLGWATKY